MASDKKKTFVQNLTQCIREYPLVGLVNLQQLPAPQLQKMRSLFLSSGIKIVMARKKLLELAMDNSGKQNIESLKNKIKGMPALLFSQTNPFVLYKILQKNKSEAPAKAGQAAPKDILVKAGPTNFAPGPIISELAAVGIKTKVDAGKLAILSDIVIAKEGEAISAKVAETLKRLDIKPMEIGLSLVAAWENGIVFEAKQLHIDEGEYLNKITTASRWAVNLALEAAYVTPFTTELLLQKAFRQAKALSSEQNIITGLTASEMISQVQRQAKTLVETANITLELENNSPKLEHEAKKKSFEPDPLKPRQEGYPLDKKHQKNVSAQQPEKKMKLENEESIIPTAQEIIKTTMAKNFDKDNQTIKLERARAKAFSAEKLIEEELNLAQQEQKEKLAVKEQQKSIREAEELYQKLKKTGTLRE